MTARITLTATRGPLEGHEFIFYRRSLCTVGRSRDCDLQIPEQGHTLSACHCLLEIDPPFIRVRDLGGLIGTYVNGQRIDPAGGDEQEEGRLLNDGDRLDLGNTSFRVGITPVPFLVRRRDGEGGREAKHHLFAWELCC
jgi:pSer/pThr/pTyr-binding forkhead associated (FHA) protein